MKNYLNIVKKILETGKSKKTRQGIDALAVAGEMFQHDMSVGFPVLTTKKIAYRLVKTELEFFIKGITDKQWLLDRNNHIWDEWANPEKAPYGHDKKSQERMAKERDLGPIYGFQWRHFNAPYKNYDTNYDNKGVDQLKKIIDILKKNPNDRRMLVSAWNPQQMDKMALPPCHFLFEITVIENKLNLLWSQRSVDVMLGLPFNIASYATLLHLIAKEAGLKEGRLIGFLGDVHLFVNHIDGAKEQISRDVNKYSLPRIKTKNFESIFDWDSDTTELIRYNSYPRIKFDIAV